MFDNLSAGKKILVPFAGIFLLFLLVSGANLLLLGRVGTHGVDVGEKLAPLGDAAMEIKLAAANAHLLMEEIMAGDTAEDVAEVEALLDQAAFFSKAILDGGKNEEWQFHPSSDPEVREKAREVLAAIDGFRAAVRSRHALLGGAQGDLHRLLAFFDQDAEHEPTKVSAEPRAA